MNRRRLECAEQSANGLPALSSTKSRFDAVRFLEEHTKNNEVIFSGLTRHDKIFINDMMLYFVAKRQPATKWAQFDPGCRRRRPYRTRWCRNSRAGSHVSSCSNPTGTMSKSRTAARSAAASQFSTTTFVCTTKQSVLSLWREVFQQTARSDRSDLGLEVRRSRWYSASRRGERDRGDWLRWWLQWRWVGLLQCGWREHRPAI
jgi:hypothetical protein